MPSSSRGDFLLDEADDDGDVDVVVVAAAVVDAAGVVGAIRTTSHRLL